MTNFNFVNNHPSKIAVRFFDNISNFSFFEDEQIIAVIYFSDNFLRMNNTHLDLFGKIV